MTTENPKPTDADKPGPLRGQIWLTLQTNQARRLIRGRNGAKGQSPIIGLGLFAERLRLIWQASRNDDPYADWWLIKVHEAIEGREALFQ
ncbi:MAG: AcaB family transcriptional regulator, partial [Sedimenticola sp.]